MTFDKLIEHNLRNIFLEKSCTNYGGETSPRPLFKKSKVNMSPDQQSDASYSLLLLYVQVEDYQDILKLRCYPLSFTLYKPLLKNKKIYGTTLPASFSA